MTTILFPNAEPNRGKTHVFIIGIGYYPCLVNPSSSLQSKLGEYDLSLEPYLSSPPISAKEFAQWMETEYNNPQAPLASIDMFISAGERQGNNIIRKTENYTSSRSGNSQEVYRATWSNIRSAFQEWLYRCNQGATKDNVAIFYFCGHGLGRIKEQTLPLENFGEYPDQLFTDDAIDLENTLTGMKTACKAKIHCYFIDSCFPPVSGLSEMSGNLGIPLARGGRIVSSVPRQLILRASPFGSTAHSNREETSYFTQALIESLNRFASEFRPDNNEPEKWIVELSCINRALKKTVKRLSNSRQTNTDCHDTSETYIFHELKEPPKLPVNVCVEPSNVAAPVQIEVKNSNNQYDLPPWDVHVQASLEYYSININSPTDHFIDPPNAQKLYANDPMNAPIKHKLTLRNNHG